jgi:hypothetical protein
MPLTYRASITPTQRPHHRSPLMPKGDFLGRSQEISLTFLPCCALSPEDCSHILMSMCFRKEGTIARRGLCVDICIIVQFTLEARNISFFCIAD